MKISYPYSKGIINPVTRREIVKKKERNRDVGLTVGSIVYR